MSTVSLSPFTGVSNDILYHTMTQLGLKDAINANKICKRWNHFIQNSNGLWKAVSQNEEIPVVHSESGQARNYREDFKVLYPMTVRLCDYEKIPCRGYTKIVGKIPPISEKIFNRLTEIDPFDTWRHQSLRENCVFVIDAPQIKTTFHRQPPESGKRTSPRYTKTFLELDETGNLVEGNGDSQQTETPLTIPLSARNIAAFGNSLLYKKKGYFPGESCQTKIMEIQPEVLDGCANKTRIYLMRKGAVDFLYSEQQISFAIPKFEATPLRVRILFDIAQTLKSITCLDNQPTLRSATYTQTEGSDPAIIRSSLSWFGPFLVKTNDQGSLTIGAPPCLRADIG